MATLKARIAAPLLGTFISFVANCWRRHFSPFSSISLWRSGHSPGRVKVSVAKNDVTLKNFHAVVIALPGNCIAELRSYIVQR